MKAFHGKQEVADLYRSRVAAHALADELVKGVYWENGKGCAVGCTVHSDNHAAFENELGIPQELARLEDFIFENLENGHAKEWPIKFLNAPRVGANLSRVHWQLLHWILTQDEFGAFKHPSVQDAVSQCAAVVHALAKGEPLDESAARCAAESAARSAAWSARSAARSAAWSARSAARCAEWSAESAASAAVLRISEKLLEFMAAAPVESV